MNDCHESSMTRRSARVSLVSVNLNTRKTYFIIRESIGVLGESKCRDELQWRGLSTKEKKDGFFVKE